MIEKICGFAVVRKPEYATTDVLKPNLRAGGRTYRGIDRLRWEDFELAYYGGNLPTHLLSIWQDLRRDNNDFSGIHLLRQYEEAKQVLEFSGPSSEIIALWSPELAECKGTINSKIKLEYLGLDCVAIGEWSVLLDGVYFKPDSFARVVERLNDHGLLSSGEDCDEVFRQYVELSSKGVVEPLADNAKAMNVSVFATIS
jgi:hypothetical protein